MSVRHDTVRSLAFRFVSLGASVITNIVIARTLGPEGKGILSFLAYLLFVVSVMGGLGLQSAAIQQIGKKLFAPSTVAGTQILLSVGAGLICGVLLLLLLPVYQSRMQIQPVFFFPFLLVVVLSLVYSNLSGVLIGLDRVRVYNWLQLLTTLSWTAGAVVVLGVAHAGRTAGVLTWMGVQCLAAIALLGWVFLRVRPRRAGLRKCAAASMRFGLEAFAAGLAWVLLLRSDGLMLGALSGPATVGIYSVAVLLAEMLWYFPQSLGLALSPRISSLPREEAILLTQRAVRLGFYAVAAAALVLLMVAPLLVRWTFGPSFLGSLQPLALLLPGIVMGSWTSALGLYFVQQKGRPRINALTSAAGLALNFLLNLWWIPRFGPSGAAAASSVAYTLVAFLLILQFRREPGSSWRGLLVIRREDLRLVQALVPFRNPA